MGLFDQPRDRSGKWAACLNFGGGGPWPNLPSWSFRYRPYKGTFSIASPCVSADYLTYSIGVFLSSVRIIRHIFSHRGQPIHDGALVGAQPKCIFKLPHATIRLVSEFAIHPKMPHYATTDILLCGSLLGASTRQDSVQHTTDSALLYRQSTVFSLLATSLPDRISRFILLESMLS